MDAVGHCVHVPESFNDSESQNRTTKSTCANSQAATATAHKIKSSIEAVRMHEPATRVDLRSLSAKEDAVSG